MSLNICSVNTVFFRGLIILITLLPIYPSYRIFLKPLKLLFSFSFCLLFIFIFFQCVQQCLFHLLFGFTFILFIFPELSGPFPLCCHLSLKCSLFCVCFPLMAVIVLPFLLFLPSYFLLSQHTSFDFLCFFVFFFLFSLITYSFMQSCLSWASLVQNICVRRRARALLRPNC